MHNGCGFLVGKNLFLGIYLVLLVAVGCPHSHTLAPFCLGLHYRVDFLAGILGIEIVKQTLERGEVILTVEAVYVI